MKGKFHKKKGKKPTMAKVERQIKRVEREVQGERKHLDYYFNATALTTAGAVTGLSEIAQGVTDITRIGNSIKVLSMEWNLLFNETTTSTTYTPLGTCCRMIIFRDMEQLGSVPSVANFLDTTVIVDPTCPRQVDVQNKDRYVVVHDKIFYFGGVTATNVSASSPPYHIERKKFQKQSAKCEYIGTAQNAGSSGKGNYFVLFIVDNVTGVPEFTGYIRFWFIDN